MFIFWTLKYQFNHEGATCHFTPCYLYEGEGGLYFFVLCDFDVVHECKCEYVHENVGVWVFVGIGKFVFKCVRAYAYQCAGKLLSSLNAEMPLWVSWCHLSSHSAIFV